MTTSSSEPRDAAVRVADIYDPREQHRESIDPDRLGALADSIAAEGMHQRIAVLEHDGAAGHELIFGHRRLLAHHLLRRETIDARIYPRGTDVLLVRASENFNREQLNPVEEAHVVRLYLERGTSRAETARVLRRSLTWVDARIALLELPEDLLDAIREHGLALAVARQLADVDHEPYRKQLVYEAVTHGATENVAAVWRQHYLSDRERIVHNVIAIEQVIQERGKYVVLYPCDWCRKEVSYEGTRTKRLCLSCSDQFDAAQAAAPPPPA